MKCDRCQQENPPHAKFCLECAAPFSGAAATATSSPEKLQAEIKTLRRSLTEAREQQAATSEVLGIISRSRSDAQPVFDTIVRSAERLCGGLFGALVRFDGELVHFVAQHNFPPAALDEVRRIWPTRPSRASGAGRAILDRAVVQIPDIELDPEYGLRRLSRAVGHRSSIYVPMLRDGVPIGVIVVARAEPGRFADNDVELLKTFADQAVIAIENVRLFTELQEKNRALTDAHAQVVETLEQQTATSEILRVISGSPTDVQPVFDAIVRSAVRLCNGFFGAVFVYDGDIASLAAQHNVPPQGLEALRRFYPGPPAPDTAPGRALLSRAVVHMHDQANDEEFTGTVARASGFRTNIAVPMLRDGQPIGAIAVARSKVQPFSEAEIELLKTFAEQAVIAIENVRLFTETKEALERQTATAEILRVISQSPTDVQPVFETIARNSMQLCESAFSVVLRYDGDLMHLGAHAHVTTEGAELLQRSLPRRPGRDSISGRAILEGAVVQVTDAQADPSYSSVYQRAHQARSGLAVPMLREGRPIGAIAVGRHEVRPFTDEQAALLQTFADQAVIAIENVRLFTELQEKNKALMQAHAQMREALEQQTATSEILRVISSAHTDAQPVFDTIVASATRLCNGLFSAVYRYDGELIHLVAHHNFSPTALAAARRTFPMPPSRGGATARAVLTGDVVHIPDLRLDPEYAHQGLARDLGFPSILAVPMLREGVPIGAIAVAGAEAAPFSNTQIALLKTFADQAVIAIENVRLFNETKEALERQTATSEILRVISRNPTDIRPVLETIVEHAGRVCGAVDAIVFLVEGDELVRAAHHGPVPIAEGSLTLPIARDSASGAAVVDCRTVHVKDLLASQEFPRGRAFAERSGFRTAVSVPLVKEGAAIGTLVMRRTEVQAFSAEQIALLETFADQAVIALENVRLFKELQDKNRELTNAHAQVSEALSQQTATGEILGVIARSPTDIQPVLDTVTESAARLCDALDASIFRVDGDAIRLIAHHGPIPSLPVGGLVVSLGNSTILGQTVTESRVWHIADVQVEGDRFPEAAEIARRLGFRAYLIVPMIRAGVAIGALALRRAEARLFTERQISLLQTFADQAAIAIENVRLFTELEARTAELTRSVDELTALGDVGRALSSTLNLEAVLQTIVTRATQLTETAGCVIWEYDKPRDEFRLRVSHYADSTDASILPARAGVTTIPRGQGLTTQVMEERQAVQIPDITIEDAYDSPVRKPLIDAGHRALLGVPLLSEDEVIGVLAVTRKTPGLFESETVRLLSTFATQSTLAIQNARLFLEIEDKSRQLEVASQHKSEFLANMSHELRTPLNAVIGFSEVLIQRMFGELNEKQDEYLKDIHASGQHLLSLINDILDLSKIEAGKMDLELSDFDMPMTIDNALMLVRERAARRSIELHTTVDERLGQIQADERKIRQVLLNLLSNAIKFTPEGGRIDVQVKPVNGSIEVSVSDTGVGIAPEDQEAVFEEFRQVGTADKKVEGTGLGLALSRKFIELHGGKIWIKSQVGAGSTFTFTVPMHRGQ